MDRRVFLHSSAGAIAGTWLAVPRQQIHLRMLHGWRPLIDDPVKTLILADVEAQRLRSNVPQSRNVLALPAVYTRCKAGGTSAELQLDAKNIVERGGDINRATLIAAPEYFRFFDDPARYAHAVGVGLTVGGVLLAPFFPVAGIALGVAGAMGEDLWKAMASGRDLTQNPFIQDDPGEKERIFRAILDAGATNHDLAAFGGVIDSPLLREKLGIDFNQSREALLDKLPEKLRAVVSEAINVSTQDLRENLARQESAVSSVLNRFSGQLDEFDRQVKEYGDLLRRQHEREEREAARARIVALQNDINAGIGIATFLLGRAMGDPQKAQEIGNVLSSVASIGFDIATGNYLGAIAAGLGLLGGAGGNPLAPVIKFLEQFGKKLDQLRTEMHERFDRLERQQQEMLLALSRIYQAVNEGFSLTNQRLSLLSQRFESYWAITNEDQRLQAVGQVTQAFSQAKLVLDAHKPGWETIYLEKLPIFVTHARIESRKSYYRGALTTGAGNLAAEVQGRKNADRLVGLIPSICLSISTSVPSDLVNPFALELGAEAYMEADILLGNAAKNSGRPQELRRMWDDGVAVRTALNGISSKGALQKLLDGYAMLSGIKGDAATVDNGTLIGAIRVMVSRWIGETLKPRYSAEEIPGGGIFKPPPPELCYGNFFDQIRVKNSPVDPVIDLGLINISDVNHEIKSGGIAGRIEEWRYRRIEIKRGPHAGLVIDGGPLGYIRTVYLDKPPAEKRSFIIPLNQGKRTNPVAHWTMEFVEYCEFLLGYYYVTEKALELPAWLRAKGFDVFPISNWTDAASALRLAAAISRWRTLEGPEIEGQTDVRNISLLSSREDVIDWLDQIVKADSAKYRETPAVYSPATGDPRETKIHARTAERVLADINAIQAAPIMPDSKSAPVVDRTLRKLAGYMTAHNIEFPVPAA